MTDISAKVERNVAIMDETKTVLDAARVMVERYIGSVVVETGANVAGIFTERDLMRVVAQQQNVAQVKLKDVMRTPVVHVNQTDSIEHCLELMRVHRCRHLLVFDGDKCAGIISLRDLAALMLEEKESLVRELTHYITT